MNFETVVQWIEDAAHDLFPLVEAQLSDKEKELVTEIAAAIEKYRAA